MEVNIELINAVRLLDQQGASKDEIEATIREHMTKTSLGDKLKLALAENKSDNEIAALIKNEFSNVSTTEAVAQALEEFERRKAVGRGERDATSFYPSMRERLADAKQKFEVAKANRIRNDAWRQKYQTMSPAERNAHNEKMKGAGVTYPSMTPPPDFMPTGKGE